MSNTIIVDTEYTTWPGALESGWAAENQHREIVQIAAVRVDDDLKETASFECMVVPKINPILSDLFVELTGIDQTEVTLRGLKFSEALNQFKAFAGSDPIVCMNGDCKVFLDNCDMNWVTYPFNRQFHRLRPLLEEVGVDLTTHSSGDLHKLTATPIEGHTHNALHDVRSMAAWLAQARIEGVYRDVGQLPTDLPLREARMSVLTDARRQAGMAVLLSAGRSRGWFDEAPEDLGRIVDAMMTRMESVD